MRGLLLSLLMLPAIGAAGANAAEITGAWDTSQGPVSISRSGDGSYAVSFKLAAGKVVGTLNGDVFKGTWIRDKIGQRCPTQKEGSPFWGDFEVTFYPNNIFVGLWTYCGDTSRGLNWTGGRPK